MASRNNDGDTPARVLADIDDTELIQCIHKKIESSPPFYHESQKVLAQKIIERIRLIFKHHHEGQLLEDFKDFDFQIYTSRNNTLKEQTKARLLNPESGCIPPAYDLGASEFADERVQLYSSSKAVEDRYAKLKEDANDNPKKLFLIVADEAHWGITSAGEEGRKKAHDKLINTWHPFKNVIVLLVTATAYNLLTDASRLPLDIFCAESLSTGDLQIARAENAPDDKTKMSMKDCEDGTDGVGPKVALHHIKWTETYSSRLEKGMKMVMRTLATSSDAKGGKPIYLGPQQYAHTKCILLVGHEEISDDLTLLFKGRNGRVKIYDAKDRQLKVLIREQEQQYDVVFVPPVVDPKLAKCFKVVDEFEMVLSFGEDIFALYPICSDRLSLYYDPDTKTIEVHRKPPTITLGNEILIELPVTDLFFIHHYENDSSNNYRYMSLNHYYNTIWHEDVNSRKIRSDDSFEKLCKEMLRDDRETLHKQTDLFIAEYCIFVICLSEFKNLFTSNSDPYDTKGVIKEINEKVREIEKKLGEFNEELPKTPGISNEKFVNQKVIEDVLEYHKPVKGNGHESMVNKWKNVLQACLFGNSKLTKELAEELGQNPDSLEILRTWKNEVINSYETGKIIAELMQITLVGGQFRGHLSVIKVNKIDEADKLFSSLEVAQDIANKNSTFLFDVVRNYSKKELRLIYNSGDERKYKLHLLVQSKRCQSNSGRGFCGCKEYTSTNPSMECTNCSHPHNSLAKCEDLEGLPAILILVDKGKMGDTFPSNFKSMDMRIKCPDRKKEGVATPDKNYVLSSTVQELGRLCHYHKEDDLENVPYALVPESTIDFLKKKTTRKEKDQGNALIYSCFKGTQSIDRYIQVKSKKTPDGDQQKTLTPTKKSCESSSENSKNMILLDAEPQCGKTGTFCNVIAELRKLICQEVSPDIDENPEEESDEDDEYEDKEGKWQYPYHEKMSSEQLTKKVGASEKYTPIHGFWSPGKAPTKIPAFQAPWSQTSPSQGQGSVSPCHEPYKAECYTHKCSDCDEKGITAAPDVFDLVIDCYKIKIHVTTENQSPHLLAKIFAANIQCTPQISNPDPEPSSADLTLSTWIFTPTAGRAKSACLNLMHTMKGPRSNNDNTEVFQTYVQVLVVQEKDFEEYCSVWGSKVTAILQLPSSMEDDGGQSVSAVEGGIGYSRRFIHLFAKILGLDHIFMIDDRVRYFKEARFESGRVKRNEDKVEFECVPLYKVLSHMERQFHRDTPMPMPSSDFDPFPFNFESDPQALCELEKYTGPSGNYAALGVLQDRPGSERVRKAFKKAHVYSLLLLNVKSTSEKKITFQPWEAFEDIDFNYRSDEKGLWVCKYNRFLKFTKPVHSAPVIFFWNDEMELTLNKGHLAKNEVQRLADWMAFQVKPARKYLLEGASQNTKLRELFQKVKAEKHDRDEFFILIDPLNIETDDLKDAIKTLSKKSKVKAQLNLYVISVPVKICLQHTLRKVGDFRRLFENIFEEGFTLQIATSHNVKEFKVEIVLIFVSGKEMADGADTAGIEDGLRDLSLGNQDGAESADTTEMTDGADKAAIEDGIRHLTLES